MKYFRVVQAVMASFLWVTLPHPAAGQASPAPPEPVPGPAEAIVRSVADPVLRGILQEVVERNPEIQAAAARAWAADQRAPQVRTLPDPQAELTVYIMPPETRVGPQRLAARLSQRFPAFGRLRLREQAALLQASAAAADVEAMRLKLLTRARQLYLEIAYLDVAADVTLSDRQTLEHFEELARARYASGVGLQQEVVRLQAEISRVDARLAELAARRAAQVAELNRLRDRPQADVSRIAALPTQLTTDLDWQALRARALSDRPELVAADSRRAAAEVGVDLAHREGSPDFTVGLMWALVDPRTDANPPGNGNDDLGVMGGVSLPIWRSRVAAAVEEASSDRLAQEAEYRAQAAVISSELGDLRGRIPEIERQLSLFEGVLRAQTNQSLRSAEAAYTTGRVDAIALLDAERAVLDVALSAERTRADLAIALAILEGTIAGPLAAPHDNGDER